MKSTGVLLAILVALSSGGCSSKSEAPPATSGLAQMDAWRAQQTAEECPAVAQNQAALNLVRKAQEDGDVGRVYGEDDPYDRVAPMLKHIWSRPNTHGDGVIVTAVRDGDGNANTADRSRYRAVWLVLDGKIYPLNTHAAGAHGVLSSGLAAEVARRAGLPEHGVNTERDLGISDFVSYRWAGAEDPLPVCG